MWRSLTAICKWVTVLWMWKAACISFLRYAFRDESTWWKITFQVLLHFNEECMNVIILSVLLASFSLQYRPVCWYINMPLIIFHGWAFLFKIKTNAAILYLSACQPVFETFLHIIIIVLFISWTELSSVFILLCVSKVFLCWYLLLFHRILLFITVILYYLLLYLFSW